MLKIPPRVGQLWFSGAFQVGKPAEKLLLCMFSRHPDIWFPSCHHCFQNIISELHQLRAIVTTVETHMNVSSPRSLSKSFLRRWNSVKRSNWEQKIEQHRTKLIEQKFLKQILRSYYKQKCLKTREANFLPKTTKQWSEGKSSKIAMKSGVLASLVCAETKSAQLF